MPVDSTFFAIQAAEPFAHSLSVRCNPESVNSSALLSVFDESIPLRLSKKRGVHPF